MNISNLFFQNFDTLLPSQPSTHIAVAVSGGADSLALCLLLHTWGQLHHLKLTAITVNHQLRSESTQEVEHVHQWLTRLGIHHETLVWTHQAINSSIQEGARDARYKLMINYCKQHSIQHLCLGHHQHDQWETFFMRLSHASGLKGLGGILPHTVRDGINIYRPFLTIDPTLLKNYLTNFEQPWVEDPSNELVKYERIRWRQQISLLSGLGLSPAVINTVCEKLSEDDKAIDWSAQNWIDAQCKFNTQLKFMTSPLTLKHVPITLMKRIALRLASMVTGTLLSSADVRHNMDSLCQKLTAEPFKAFTLGGCYWMQHQNLLYIVREWNKCPKVSITAPDMTYDNRFKLTDLAIEKVLEPVSKKYWPLMKSMVHPTPFPYQVFLSLPVIIEDDKIIWQNLLM